MKTIETDEDIKSAKARALAQELHENTDDIDETKLDADTYTCGAHDYLVLTDAEADKRAAEAIKESAWAFNADFILGECGLDLSGAESLKSMQEKSCEDANDFIVSLIEKTCGMEQFVDSAVSADGRGHFLSGYDSNEREQVIDNIIYYIYKQ